MNRPFPSVVFSFVVCLLMTETVFAAPPSIVLISVDTLRADHLSAYRYPKTTSPSIDAVAARGLVFDRAIVPEPQTSPSHASLLTGVGPWKHGVTTNGFRIADGIDTLPDALRRAGYDTAGVVAIAHLGSSRGFGRGFMRFSEPRALLPGETHISSRRDAGTVNAEAVRMIDAHVATRPRSPMFLFVHYFDCHYPYRSWDLTEDKSKAFLPDEQRQTARQLQRYDDGVTWTDRHIGELLAAVRAKLGENVVIVITADHGEQIGDHDVPVGHADLYRETVRVPLIVAGPGIDADHVRTRVSNMDIPIALARLGGASLKNKVDGTDLLKVADRDTSLFHRLLGGPTERTFIVFGGPLYTRSLALIQDNKWYIRNFDSAYRNAKISTPAPASGGPTKTLPGTVENGRMVYVVPVQRYAPLSVTVEHTAASPQCAATAHILIEPGIEYYRQPTSFRQSVRMTVPAARGDVVRLEISPASCAGTTRYEVARQAPPGTTTSPDLFQYLVARRLRSGDELYDTDEDPLMRHNVLTSGEAETYDRRLRALFETTMSRSAMESVPDEMLATLKSLGYL